MYVIGWISLPFLRHWNTDRGRDFLGRLAGLGANEELSVISRTAFLGSMEIQKVRLTLCHAS